MGEWSQNSSERVAKTWKNLADSFGPRFLRDFGKEAPPIWSSAIAKLNDIEIARGFRRLSTRGLSSPPTLPQFMKACQEIGDNEGEMRPRQTYQALPNPDNRDKYDRFADHLFLNYLMRKQGCDLVVLPQLLNIKRQTTQIYREIGQEEQVEPKEMRDYLHKCWDKAWKEPSA